MRTNLLINITILALTTLLASCATTPRVTNLSPAYLYYTPSVSNYQDPEADLMRYLTFSVFPFSLISKDVKMNEIMEKQLLFFLRNQLEAKGYRFVQLNENPDFLVTINAFSEYKESYVPPQTVTLPRWVPGQTITTYGSTYGSFNYNTFGDYSSYGWGSYSGQTTSTTYIPGYMTTETYTRPGYTVGHYYPVVAISIYDSKTLRKVWLGTGAGTSDNSDIRISSQLVVSHVLAKFPNATHPWTVDNTPRGILGIQVGIFTNDGNAYVPTILSLDEKSPARKAGIKPYDMILSVNGVSVVNKPFSEVIELIRGEPGTGVQLEVWRVGEKHSFEVIRMDRSNLR